MDKTFKSQLLKAQLQASVYGLASSLSLFISGGAYGFGVYLITLGLMTPYQVYQVITSLNMSTMGVMNMAAFLPEILKARMAGGLIFAIIRREPSIDITSRKGLKEVSFCCCEEYINGCSEMCTMSSPTNEQC
ncbi:unnamed protein product [Anisakis simplex]|uniref:ABC transmembrane type-1 domain-containing protein n=1 Tax=Anisakis simplex TaxID=6269 RepID=A0A0M3JG18_ANISI|nr:unnamed protein product [Anisakis simplex]